MGPSLGGFLLETFDFPIASTVMAAFSFSLVKHDLKIKLIQPNIEPILIAV
jgi:hypothetical protein